MKKIAIRLDTGQSIGLGHMIRCLALADECSLISNSKIIFICRNKWEGMIPYPVISIKKPYITNEKIYEFPSIIDEIDEVSEIIAQENIDCLIVDHYGAKDDYFRKLKNRVPYLVCIDDGLQRDVLADAVINGNVYGADAQYGNVPLKLIGSRYLLMRKEFRNVSTRQNNQTIKEIYITSGGADPCEFCCKISDALIKNFSTLRIHVIAGCNFTRSYIKKLQEKNLVIHQNANMKECMRNADFFISAAGSTLYELASCGVPSVCYTLANDQRLLAEYMNRKGTTCAAGDFEAFNETQFCRQCSILFSDKEKRDNMSKNGQRLVDGYGVSRTAEKILQLCGAKIPMVVKNGETQQN